jgi:hypothetical protein
MPDMYERCRFSLTPLPQSETTPLADEASERSNYLEGSGGGLRVNTRHHNT